MTTEELIEILERELGTVKSNNVVDKARDEIVARLEEYNTLKEDYNKILKERNELICDSLRETLKKMRA